MVSAMPSDLVDPFFALQVGDFACFCVCQAPPKQLDLVVRRGAQDAGSAAGRRRSRVPEAPHGQAAGPQGALRRSFSARADAAGGTGGTGTPANGEVALSEEHPLAAAVRLGRFLEARRQLHRMEAEGHDPSQVLDAATLERLARILEKYDSSQSILSTSVFDLPVSEVNEEMHLQWGVEVAGSTLRFIYEIEEEHDFVRGFVGVQERDLHKVFNKGVLSAEMLGKNTPNDGLWRSITLSQSTGMKGDNVALVSSIDALDEPGGHIWACTYSPPEGVEEVGGVPLPPVLEGHHRLPYSFWATTMTPTISRSDGKIRGYKMKVAVEMELPYMALKIVEMMPRILLRRLARSKMEQSPKDFRRFVQSSHEIDDRLQKSPRAEFYERLRRHLAELEAAAAA